MPRSENVRRPGCDSCRSRHIKCDKGDPCGQCVKKNKVCVRGTKLKFRHITVSSGTTGNRSDQLYEFSDAQKWCKVSGKRIRFIDETADINSIHNEDFESDDDIISDEESPPSPPKPTQRAIREDTNNVAYSSQRNGKTPETNAKRLGEGDALPIERGQPYPLIKLPALHPHPTFHSPDSLGHLSIDEPPQTFSPAPRSQLSGPIGSISSIGSNSWSEDPSLPEPRRSFHTTNFPLKDYREANLIRYFIEVIAPFFDYGDPRDRFRTLLPQQAAKSPLLLNAVLAIAAKSKDVDGSLAFFDKPAEHYYGEALNLLQPFLGSLAQEVDDHQVTAAVLLRLYHSIEVSVFSADSQHSIVSSSISELLASRAPLIPKGGLAEAALWGWIRLEVFRAVMQQEVLDLSLDRLELDRSVEPADDETWMWRMVLHSIDILRYCFGAKGSSATYEKLSAYAARWMRSVPETFLPIYFNPSTGNAPFPEVLFLTESVVVGLQFYHLNRILLMAHNPNMPRLGKNQKLAARALDDEIISDLKIMCGIAESHGRGTPAHILACMGITLAGDRFKLPAEQEALLKIFTSTAEVYRWDTVQIVQHLKEAWSWPEDTVSEPT